MNSGIGVILIGDSRGVAKQSERVSPAELIGTFSSVTTTLITAVEKCGGTVYQYVGGSFIAYWLPEKMPAAARDAISAAADTIAACGETVAVSVAIADFAIAEVGAGSAQRSTLVGPAYQRAEATIRVSASGRVAVDSETLRILPSDISDRFVVKEGYAEL